MTLTVRPGMPASLSVPVLGVAVGRRYPYSGPHALPLFVVIYHQ